MKIEATILVDPIGKARPRHKIVYGELGEARVMSYTPEPTLTAQGIIQVYIRNIVLAKGQFPPGVPLKMEAIFFRQRPKSVKKSLGKPVTKPDWDNLGKLVSDALEKFVYRNDSQISTAIIKKRFGHPPRIELILEEDVDE